MEAIPQDLARIGFGCCISDVNSPLAVSEYTRDEQKDAVRPQKLAPRRSRLTSRMTSSLRMSSKNLVTSFTKGIAFDENMYVSVTGCISSAAQVVADDYFAQDPDPELFSMPSLLDTEGGGDLDEIKCQDKEDSTATTYFDDIKYQDKDSTATTCSESKHSTPSYEDALALEVGLSAQEYLDECFYAEVSVLDRDKFDAIPEIVKSDFTTLGHLGKGNFSDVFEVVRKSGSQVDAKASNTIPGGAQTTRRRSVRGRRSTLSSSITSATLARPSQWGKPKNSFALKCLRPQIRSDVDQFTIGAEDLVHETAILANLNHRHIIKLHGRASGHLSDAFVLNDGYFILLDKLDETLHDRIGEWKLNSKCTIEGLTSKQMEVALSIADAMCYLHSKKIVFRDLKPANVGFDSMGVLKLFDFGFAIGLPEKTVPNPSGLLCDRCGTPRYMAPEVGLSLGYSLPADVYSFGILLWEICSLSKPFSSIKTSAEFDWRVFSEGERPPLETNWPGAVKDLMSTCWRALPSKRPNMLDVKSALSPALLNSDENKISAKTVRSRMTRRRSDVGW